MQPIEDIAELRQGHVLYHSAFGFARVQAIREADVEVAWAKQDRNLPQVVARDALRRVYSLCRPQGFFEQALLNPEGLREQIQADALSSLEMLLEDLPGPQGSRDIREWILTLQLLPESSFDRWWQRVESLAGRDKRFRQSKGVFSLAQSPRATETARQFDDPLLSPGRRLEVALELRSRIGEEAFLQQISHAWRTGSVQVRDLALQALAGHHPNQVLSALLAPGADNAEAIVHALMRTSWSPDQFDPEVLEALAARTLEGAHQSGLLEGEGRLVAALARWWPQGGLPLCVTLAESTRGQNLLNAAFESLGGERAESLKLSILAQAIDEHSAAATRWLAFTVIEESGQSVAQTAQRIEAQYPTVARWLRHHVPELNTFDLDDITEDTPLVTVEMDLEPVEGEEESMPLGDLPRRNGRSFLGLAIALAKALAGPHADGRIVNPTGQTFALRLDGSLELRLDRGDAAESPRPIGEPPSLAGDVYATAILLVEALIGRSWPRAMNGDRGLPYLRHVVPDLPPAALAPLDQALHPNPSCRPADATLWLNAWQAVARTESARRAADPNAKQPLMIGYDTHIGLMKMLHSQTNQDALAVSSRDYVHLLCVCDGISTANAGSGDVASGTTANVVGSLWEQNVSRLADADDFVAEAFIERALALANRAVCQNALQFAQGDLVGRIPMGSTVVVALVRGARVQLGWLGDSRAYLVGPYGASLLTADMNQAAERLVAWTAGKEPRWDGSGFALVGYIGHFNEEIRPEPLTPRQMSFTMLPGERLVLCTDGVTDYVHPHPSGASAAVARVSTQFPPFDAAAELIGEANRGGGGDNCTAIVATMLPERQPTAAKAGEAD
jgi:serine/threonine protein phosphatase PrpC